MRLKNNQQHTLLAPSAVVAIATLMLSACGEPPKEDLAAYVERVQSQYQADIPPIPSMQIFENFNYAAFNLRDPFIPTVIDVPVEEEEPELFDSGVQPDSNRRKEALEAYDLRDLQFTGTIEQERIWGLVRTPDGVIHRVQTGNYLGTNHGKILAITDTALQLLEIVPEGGGYIERETALSVIELR
ncbi:MAG: pilus assembly protein PilP [Methylophaga sp.]|nr:pilus assembly protein PilP [Methylophaga sp.]